MYHYLAYSAIAMKEGIAFRVNLFTSMFGGLFQLILLTSVWRAMYLGQGDLAGYDESEMLFYVVVATAMGVGGLLSVGSIIGQRNDTGDIVIDMARPVSVPWSYFFSTLGVYALRFWIKGIPTLIIGLILIGRVPPVKVYQLAAFLLLLGGGSFLHFCLNLGVASFAFRTRSAYGINILWTAAVAFFAGLLVPIAFYPEALRQVVEWTPFPSVAYTPIRVLMGDEAAMGGIGALYTGVLRCPSVLGAVLEQMSWILITLPLAFRVYRWNEKRVEIQGG